MSDIQIRPVRVTELDRLVQLCAEHARHEGFPHDAADKVAGLCTLIFSDQPKLHCLVVEVNRQLVGYASWMIQYSTWHARQYLYLDCLYFAPGYRGRGLGRELLNMVCEFAKQRGCEEVQWQTPCENQSAIGFYDAIAGTRRSNKFRYQLFQREFVNTH